MHEASLTLPIVTEGNTRCMRQAPPGVSVFFGNGHWVDETQTNHRVCLQLPGAGSQTVLALPSQRAS